MTERKGAFREIRSSPEVQAYTAWLKGVKEKEGVLPPREKQAALKETLRGVSERKNSIKEGRKAKEHVEKEQEKERGEARLREVVERGDLNESFLQHLGAYLAREPWEALALLEENQPILETCIKSERALRSKYTAQITEEKRRQKDIGYREEQAVEQISDIMFMRALERHNLALLRAKELDGSIPKDNYFGTSVRGGVPPLGTECHIPHKKRLTGHAQPYEQRSDYWTMARAIVRTDPKAYGFTSKKEVDLLLGQRIEEIGRTLGRKFWLEDGIARVERKGLKKPEVEALEVQDAQEIIENEREAKRVAERREQEFLKDMREMLRELSEVNRRLEGTDTALVPKRGFFANLAYTLSGREAQDAEERSHENAALKQKRWDLVQRLIKRNNEVWPGGNNIPKYTQRFEAPEGYKPPRNVKGRSLFIHIWSAVAEAEEMRLGEELMNEGRRPAQEE